MKTTRTAKTPAAVTCTICGEKHTVTAEMMVDSETGRPLPLKVAARIAHYEAAPAAPALPDRVACSICGGHHTVTAAMMVDGATGERLTLRSAAMTAHFYEATVANSAGPFRAFAH